jgi:hypothetical protein
VAISRYSVVAAVPFADCTPTAKNEPNELASDVADMYYSATFLVFKDALCASLDTLLVLVSTSIAPNCIGSYTLSTSELHPT